VSFSQIPVDEWWALAVFYCGSLGCCAFLTGGLWMTLAWISKGRDKRVSSLAYFIPIVPVIIWCTYAVDTAKEAFAITSLDSENNIYAESLF
jgi:hypothetical protein